jgi:hypothetical protein
MMSRHWSVDKKVLNRRGKLDTIPVEGLIIGKGGVNDSFETKITNIDFFEYQDCDEGIPPEILVCFDSPRRTYPVFLTGDPKKMAEVLEVVADKLRNLEVKCPK